LDFFNGLPGDVRAHVEDVFTNGKWHAKNLPLNLARA
jgi:hypothetical protein